MNENTPGRPPGLTPPVIRLIRRTYAERRLMGVRKNDPWRKTLARRYDISVGLIGYICSGRCYRWVS